MKTHLLPTFFVINKKFTWRNTSKPYLPTGMKQRDSTEITVSPLTTSSTQEDKSFALRNLHYHRERKQEKTSWWNRIHNKCVGARWTQDTAGCSSSVSSGFTACSKIKCMHCQIYLAISVYVFLIYVHIIFRLLPQELNTSQSCCVLAKTSPHYMFPSTPP